MIHRRLSVAVTELEWYRRYLDPDRDLQLGDLLNFVNRTTPPTPAMEAGKAFHAFLEFAGAGVFSHAQASGYHFRFANDMEIALPAMREMRTLRALQIDDVAVTLSGIVDAVDATTVFDHKLTSRYDPEQYLESYQWRCYLWMLLKPRFQYNVFSRRDELDDDGAIQIYRCDHVKTFAYPEMERDVVTLLADYVCFADRYLRERFLSCS